MLDAACSRFGKTCLVARRSGSGHPQSEPETRSSAPVVRAVILWAVVGSSLAVGLAAVHAQGSGLGAVAFVQPGVEGKGAPLLARDFPELDLPSGVGHDGQYFYVIARNPTDSEALTEHLGRPRYRLQRPVFPALAWMLHPSGGGYGLVYAMLAVGGVALVLLGAAVGMLSVRLGGPAMVAAVVPLLPGSVWAFRLGLADNLALALLVAYLWMAHEERARAAMLLAIAAALTREAVLVVILADALFRRSPTSSKAAAAALVAVGGWWLGLRTTIDTAGAQVQEFTVPLTGIAENLEYWAGGNHLLAASTTAVTLALATYVAGRRGPKHPLFAPVIASTAFTLVLARDVLALDHNGTRAMAPALVLALLAALTPDAGHGGPIA